MTELESLTQNLDFDTRMKFNMQNLGRIDKMASHADSKSAMIASANVGMFSIMLSIFSATSGKLVEFQSPAFTYILLAVFIIYIVMISTSIIFAMRALFPRLTPGAESLFYFGHVQSFADAASLSRKFSEATYAQMLTDIEVQIFENSNIVMMKFERLQHSTRLFYTGGVVWMALMITMFILMVTSVI